MWKSKDVSILFAKKFNPGNKICLCHDLKRRKGTNIAECNKCKATFIVNCEYK